jgi:hypothetical protein
MAMQLAVPRRWTIGWLPAELARYKLVFGLWKGDLTLKRAIVSAMENARRSGEMAAIVARYVPSGSTAQDDPSDGGFSGSE